jgi:CRP-like cAMP-binding protein
LKEKYIKILQKSMLFEKFSENDLKDILKCLGAETLNVKKDEFIAIAGDELKKIGIVLDGSVVVLKENISGNRVIMSVLSVGDMFGEMAAYSKMSVWPASVQAQEESAVMFISRDKILGQCEKACIWHTELIRNMLSIISERAILLNRKIEYLTIKSIRGKLAAFFLEKTKMFKSNTFMLSMNRNELADFLNVSRPSMSREMIKMKEEEIIDFHLNTIKVLDKKKLIEINN